MKRILMTALLLGLASAGCEQSGSPSASSSGPVKVCKRAGQRCLVQKGKLGVCIASDDSGSAPKLRCASQH